MSAPKTVDEYLVGVPDEMRPALADLRAKIRAAAPDAVEAISYGVPAFRSNHPIVSFGAAKAHCSFFVQSPAVMEAFKDDVAGYSTSKGTIRFQPEERLPADLVTRLVQARIAENAAMDAKKTSGRKPRREKESK